MNETILDFRELLWDTKDEKLRFRRFKKETFERHLVEYVSISVFKMSDVMRKI